MQILHLCRQLVLPSCGGEYGCDSLSLTVRYLFCVRGCISVSFCREIYRLFLFMYNTNKFVAIVNDYVIKYKEGKEDSFMNPA